MNTIDLVILIVLLAFTLLGLMRGFIQGVGSLIGLFVGLFLAGKFAWPVAAYIRGGFAQYPAVADPLSYLVGFFLIFAVVTFVISILIKTIDKVFNIFAVLPFLKTINRLGGALLGLLEGALLISAVVYMLITLPVDFGMSERIANSASGPFFRTLAFAVKPFLPDFGTIDVKKLLSPPQFVVPADGASPADVRK